MTKKLIAHFSSHRLAMTCIIIICCGLSAVGISYGTRNQSALFGKANFDANPVVASNQDGPQSLSMNRKTSDAAPLRSIQPDAATTARIRETYSKIPMIFEDSRDASNSSVKFISRGNGYSLFLASTEALFVLKNANQRNHVRMDVLGKTGEHRPEAQASSAAKAAPTMLKMKFLGSATDPQITGKDLLAGTSNYFIGNDRGKWRSNVPNYARVSYHDLYPGIDLVFYGNQRQLEYDFIVGSGSDPGTIKLQFEGADRLEVDNRGNLILHTADGPVTQQKPIMYQLANGTRKSVDGNYVLRGKDQVGFQIAAYDADKPLIIDPVLVYSTYLGGTNQIYPGYGYGWDFGVGITVDSSGNAYVVGDTWSTDFPVKDPFQAINNEPYGGYNAFVSKLSADGSTLLYSTYLGGSGSVGENGTEIALDPQGNIYITGNTDSPDFPTTPGAFDISCGTDGTCNYDDLTHVTQSDAFITVMNAAGSALLYSSYLGGSGSDVATGISVDASGVIYVTGFTNSADFPVKNAIQGTYGGGANDAFVAKVDPSQSGQGSLVYSTFLGGAGDDRSNRIRLDASGNIFLTGLTASNDFPIKDAFQGTYGGGAFDAFVTKMNGANGAIIYSTFLGGSGEDRGIGLAVDTFGNAYVAGRTASANFPTTAGAFDTSCGTDGTCNDDGLQPPDHVTRYDAFVTKLNAGGSALVYSTYLGGAGDDQGLATAADAAGHAYVVGTTRSTNFPCANPLQAVLKGDVDIFIAKLNVQGSSLIYSTYLGGSALDEGDGIPDESAQSVAIDASGNAYVTGYTLSTDFPTTANAFQTTNKESYEAFIVKIASSVDDMINDKIGIYTNGSWYLDKNSNNVWEGALTDGLLVFGGIANDYPVTGDWNGDGKTKIGIYTNGVWYLDWNGNGVWDGIAGGDRQYFFGGIANDRPVTGDWNGDGKTKIGIYTNGTWYLDLNGNGVWDDGTAGVKFFGGGLPGAVPVTGDWNGSGTTKIGIYSNGVWYLDKSGNGVWDGTPTDSVYFFGGMPGAVPVTGDWTGTGTTKIGIYTNGVWYLDLNGNGAWNGTPTDGVHFFGGGPGDVPVTGKW